MPKPIYDLTPEMLAVLTAQASDKDQLAALIIAFCYRPDQPSERLPVRAYLALRKEVANA